MRKSSSQYTPFSNNQFKVLLLIILDEAIKKSTSCLAKRNQKITQVFTPLTPSKADDFQASDLPGPIRNQTQIKFDKVKWSKN